MFEGLVEKRGGKSAKVSAKPTKSGRLDFLKKVFCIVSETERVNFHLLPKDYVVLASLAEEAEIGLSEFFCR